MSVMSQPFGSRSWSWNGRAGRRGTCTCGGTFTCFVRAESEQSLDMLRQSSLGEHCQNAHYVRFHQVSPEFDNGFPCKSANNKAASSSPLYQSCKHIHAKPVVPGSPCRMPFATGFCCGKELAAYFRWSWRP